MVELVVALLVLVVVLTILTRLGALWMGRKAGQRTRQRFEEAEHIIDTGQPPESWLAGTAKLPPEARRAKLMTRLEGLTVFFRESPVVADRATRELLLEKLAAIGKQWQDGVPDQGLRGSGLDAD